MKCECFIVEGVVPDLISSPRVVELLIYDDGTLCGSVLDMRGEAEKFMLLHGAATRDGSVYNVRFQLVRGMWALYGVGRVADVEGTLSSQSGFAGRWSKRGALLPTQHPFHLPVLPRRSDERLSVTQTVKPLNPMAPGVYTLKGAALGDNGFLYPATWRLQLREDGVLKGTSSEEDTVCRLEGSWSSTGVLITYHGADNKDYVYEGNASTAALRGQWRYRFSDNSAARGTFDFGFEVVRLLAWSHSNHKHFPKAFREVVWLCLLSSTRPSEASDSVSRIPSHLWSEVFSYCASDWFPEPKSASTLSSTLTEAVGGLTKMLVKAFR